VADVLHEAGVRCGHEAVFTPRGVRPTFRLDGDASYLAVPHLADYPGKVVHLVRNPVHVVRSLVGTAFFDRDDLWLEPVLPYVERTGDLVLDSVRYCVTWNEMIEPYADLRVRIEDFDEHLPEVLALVAPKRAARARVGPSTVPTDTNARPRAEGIRTGQDLPPGPERDALVRMGTRYGYDLTTGA